MDTHSSHSEHDPEGPHDLPALATELRRLQEVSPAPVGVVDDAVRAAIDDHFDRFDRNCSPRRRSRWWIGSVAAAAMIVIGVWLALPRSVPEAERTVVQSSDPADVDGSGRVDILDAFALARRLEREQGDDVQPDMNGDGHVDDDDVDVIAQRAVSLSRGA